VSEPTDADLEAARNGDEAAFARLVGPHRRALHAHCYRLLGSVADADDAVQDALVGAWKGLGGFEGRSPLRSWLYRIATNAALRTARRRSGPRRLSADQAPARTDVHDIGSPVTEAVFVEPYPDAGLADASLRGDPAARYDELESVELAFVAALQELPATQRAVLVLRDVLALPAAEVADVLDTSVAAVNSSLQRARSAVEARRGPTGQRQARAALGDEGQRRLVDALVTAWERRDVEGLVGLLAEDVRLAMPPYPAWYDGLPAVLAFFAERLYERPWRLLPATANGQLALACYQTDDAGGLPLTGITVLTVRGDRIAALDSFLEPAWHLPFDFPGKFPGTR
jgi:RNA polymerase sigma-70 factor (TIGR02960 family)